MAILKYFTLLMLEVFWIVTAQTDSTENGERDIFFNSNHYQDAKQEAKENVIKSALKICPNHTKEILEKEEEFEECSGKINEDNMTLCEVIEEDLKVCVVPMIQLFETCVPPQAKGIPTYIRVTASKILKYLCNTDGAHILELGNPCILSKRHPYSMSCIRKLRRELNKYDLQNLPEKAVFCLFLSEFKDCFDSHLNNSCEDPTTREAYKGLYSQLLCSK